MAEASPSNSKRRRISRKTGSGDGAGVSGGQAGDSPHLQQIREWKKTFESHFLSADRLLNSVGDESVATGIWSEMESMSSCFSQLLHRMVTATTVTTRLERELNEKSEEVNSLNCELIEVTQLLEEKEKEIVRQKSELIQTQKQLLDSQKEVSSLRQKLSPAQRLPVKCIQHIISFCGVRDVFRSYILVSKQWNEASKADLKTRDSVNIHYDCEIQSYVWSWGPNDHILLPLGDEEQMDMVIRSHMQMTGVRNLSVKYVLCYLATHFVPLLKMWSASLQSLSLQDSRFPNGLNLSFPRLKCLKADGDAIEAGTDLLRTAHLNHIQKLDIEFGAEDFPLSLVPNLRDLTVTVFYSPNGHPVLKLMKSVTNLLRFSVTDRSFGFEVDAGVAELVKRNPKVEEVFLFDVLMTDESLKSLSKLKNLKRLHIRTENTSLSPHAVLKFLTRRLTNQVMEVRITGIQSLGQKEDEIRELVNSRNKICDIFDGKIWVRSPF